MMCDNTKNTVAIDFDGVIHKYSKGWDDGSIYDKPVEGVHKALMELMKDYWVYIFTTRSVGAVKDWMNGQFWGAGEMGFRTIAMPEGIRFNGNWEDILKEIKEIRGW